MSYNADISDAKDLFQKSFHTKLQKADGEQRKRSVLF